MSYFLEKSRYCLALISILGMTFPTVAQVNNPNLEINHEGENLTEALTPLEPVREEQGVEVPPSLFPGAIIDRVVIYLRNPTSDNAKNEQYQQQIAQRFQIRASSRFSSIFADFSLRQVQQLPFVAKAEYRLYEANRQGRVFLAVLVTLQEKESEIIPKKRGIFVDGDFRQFPTLYESDRTLVKVILNGGVGVFNDINPWFDNSEDFLAGEYQPKETISHDTHPWITLQFSLFLGF